MKETIILMRKLFQEQVRRLKEDWENGRSGYCERDYKIQLKIWEEKIKEFDRMLD